MIILKIDGKSFVIEDLYDACDYLDNIGETKLSNFTRSEINKMKKKFDNEIEDVQQQAYSEGWCDCINKNHI